MSSHSYNLRIQMIRAIACLICILPISSLSGCQFAPKEKPIKWPWKKDKTKTLPDRILPVWTESVLHQPNQPGVRGFGGRIYFYEKDDTNPIEIDGSLAVYVFDADEIDVTSQKPLRKFMFTKEQFDEHMSKTSIGPSYSIWLPWGEIGGPPRRLSLIARFEGHEGGTVISDPTVKLLPGVPSKEQATDSVSGTKSSASSPFRLSSHEKKFEAKASGRKLTDEHSTENSEEVADLDNESGTRADSTKDPRRDIKTIDLPPSFQRHLRGTSTEATETTPLQATSSTAVPANQIPATQIPVAEKVNDPQVPLTNLEPNSPQPPASPMTTQVYDYRTRKSQGSSAFSSPKNDIREGRWINAIARD